MLVSLTQRREFIKTHLDLMGLKYDSTDITCIHESLGGSYRAIDVAIAYGKHYHTKHTCVELHRSKARK
jgi:hypothetical protein